MEETSDSVLHRCLIYKKIHIDKVIISAFMALSAPQREGSYGVGLILAYQHFGI